jgi:hypothetical protein
MQGDSLGQVVSKPIMYEPGILSYEVYWFDSSLVSTEYEDYVRRARGDYLIMKLDIERDL